jgi:hypothetical protein
MFYACNATQKEPRATKLLVEALKCYYGRLGCQVVKARRCYVVKIT